MKHEPDPPRTPGSSGPPASGSNRRREALTSDEATAFDAALMRLLAAGRAYHRLNALTVGSPGYRDPAAFCRQVTDDVLGGAGVADAGGRRRFFDQVLSRAPNSVFLLVLACDDRLRDGDHRTALSHAQRAVSLDQQDLYAQSLYRQCRASPAAEPDPHGRFCSMPFDHMDIYPDGKVYFCCNAWLPVPIGDINRQSPEEIWNSQAARDIRRSILDGTYRYCSRMHCPKLMGNTLPPSEAVRDRDLRAIIDAGRTELARGPREVMLTYDRSCNLSCPSCRKETFIARKEEQDRLNVIADRVILPLLRGAEKVDLSGSGDPFASGHFRYLLTRINCAEFPRLKMHLHTNGLLFDRKVWEELGLSGLVRRAYISIDAACEATYAVVRRGGSFARLLENLAFVAELRRAGELGFVRLDFVTQALNFREMPDVVDIARGFGFDGVKFQMIRNWGTYGAGEFERHNIGSPDHPLFGEFLDVLADERLRSDGVEYWGFHSVDPGLHRTPAVRRDGGARPARQPIGDARTGALAVVHLSDDGPDADAFWADLREKCPRAKRVHGVRGFGAALKEAARLAETAHFIAVGAESLVDPGFFDLTIEEGRLRPSTVIRWPGRNTINELVQIDGTLACWPRDLALTMRAVEAIDPGDGAVEFRFSGDFNRPDGPFCIDEPVAFARSHTGSSPFRAFRAAFREGVRLSLVDGHKPLRERRPQDLDPERLHGLLVWCSVGADVGAGLWSLYGARLAAYMINLTNWYYVPIIDDAWFTRFWREEIAPRFAVEDGRGEGLTWDSVRLGQEVEQLGGVLRAELALDVADLDAAESRFFKTVYAPVPPPRDLSRLGGMLHRGVGAGQDPAAAFICYSAAAGAGDADALHNVARLGREGIGTEKSLPRALVLLREAAALGSAAASHELGRMYRKGWGVERDSRRALECFTEAAVRGFRTAHAEMAEMYEAGEGVPADLRRALSHYKRAPQRPEIVKRARRLDRVLMAGV